MALDDEFPNRWIGRGRPTLWPAQFPYIIPWDFFLLGYVKTTFLRSELKDIDDLETKINEAVASVQPEMLVKTWKEVKSRLKMLAENGERHVEGWTHFFYQTFVASLIIKKVKYFLKTINVYLVHLKLISRC